MIRPATSADIPNLLAACRTEAWKLELRDDYATADEREALERWRRGEREPDQAQSASLGAWLDAVRTAVAHGAHVRRVRVVTEPVTDYIKFEAVTVPLSTAAGEDIRYLPRHHPAAGQLGDRDFWLLDDQVMILNFTGDGTPQPYELHDDPDVVDRYRAVRDLAWRHAIPYADYAHHLQ